MGFISVHHESSWVIIPTITVDTGVRCDCCDHEAVAIMITWATWSFGIIFER